MSEEKTQYEIRTQYPMDPVTRQWISTKGEPQGEICSWHDDEIEPDEPEAETLEARITRTENLMKELNMAWLEIEPWIVQKKVTRASKKGLKSCYPCANRLFAIMTNLSREIYQLRREAGRE